jgi:hypothetical protein
MWTMLADTVDLGILERDHLLLPPLEEAVDGHQQNVP